MHFVEQAGLEILPDCGSTATDKDILVACRLTSALERGVDAIGDEMEDGAAFHLLRRTLVVREYEYGHMIGRILAPPTAPRFIRPRAPAVTHHATAHAP